MSRYPCTLGCDSSDGLAIYENGLYCHACKRTKKMNSFRHPKKDSTITLTFSNSWLETSKEFFEFLKQWEDYIWSYGALNKLDADICEHIPEIIITSSDGKETKFFNYIGFHLISRQQDNHEKIIVCRRLTEFGPKWVKYFYHNSTISGDEKKLNLWHPIASDISPTKTIFITEDIISSLCIGDLNDSFPLLGTHLKKEDANWLASTYRNAVIWLDDDEAGHMAEEKILNQLCNIFKGFVRVITSTKEPKHFARGDLQQFIEDLGYVN